MKEKIDNIVKEGDWEFSKLLKLKEISQQLADDLYSELSTEEIQNWYGIQTLMRIILLVK